MLRALVELGCGVREAARAGGFGPGLGAGLIVEPGDIDLEAAAWVVAQLGAREADRRGVVCNRLRGRSVPAVAKDAFPPADLLCLDALQRHGDRKSTRLNSSHLGISYAVFCLKQKKQKI